MKLHARQLRNRFLCALILTITTSLVALSPASGDIGFCPSGSSAGQCNNPAGVAVNQSSGHVYVADAGNHRVNVFDEDGNFLSSFGSAGSGPGQLANPLRIAVDNNPASPNFQDVFVADSNPNPAESPAPPNQRIQRFNSAGVFEATIGLGQLNRSNPPISIGPGNNLYVVDSVGRGSEAENRQVKIFSPAGSLIGSSAIGSVAFDDAVVDVTGNLYIVQNSDLSIAKYELSEPTATLLKSGISASVRALAVDKENNVYAAQFILKDSLRIITITKLNSAGVEVKVFGYGEADFPFVGMAVGATGSLFGSLFGSVPGDKVLRVPQPPPGPLPCCLEVQPGNTKATVKAGLNPEGKPTTYHFEYITEDDFVANKESFGGPNLPVETPESAPVGPDFELYEVKASLGCKTPEVPPQPTCLKPETAYRYRLVAKNEDGENFAEGQFETKAPFEIGDTYATEVGTGDARVHAEVNPLGIPATAYFEYVDEASYQASGFAEASKTSQVELGSGEAEVQVSAQLTQLAPATIYHYRLVASDPFVEEPGPERTLTTFPLPKQPTNSCSNAVFRTGPSAFLPDCRAYEMVSPVDKNGGDIKVLVQGISFPARLDQSADSGERFAYSSIAAFAGAQSSPWSSQYMATRIKGEGWSTEAINPPQEVPSLANNPVLKLDVQYRAFSPDLSTAWLSHHTNPPLDECAPEGFINLYRRDNLTGDYEALVTNEPTNIDKNPDYRLELQGLSADGTHAVFRANAKLTEDASNSSGPNSYQLYMHFAGEGCGELRLVSVLPNGQANALAASVGTPGGPAEYRGSAVKRAVSVDGRRIFFTAEKIPLGEGSLYVRVNADKEQSTVSEGKCTEPELGCTLQISKAAARFWTATTNGSRAIYSVGEDLFEYDVEKALAGEAATTLIAGKARGVAAASEDASRVYFVSREAIDGEGEAGEPNLYLYEPVQSGPERYRLVATLTDQDVESLLFYGLGVGVPTPISNGVRLSPDGDHLAFVSAANLTGYDNTDTADGRPAIELHLYDAESEEVRCISCNPSGARPQGRLFEEGITIRRVAAMMPPGESQSFAPRALSNDGNSLFFESFEALLPRDVNGKADAYSWQRASSQAECEENGAELYVPSAGGCLSLISTGLSPSDTEIADATPDGSNVFIRTAESLLPQDPGQVDIYVARVNGGFPQPPSQAAACEGEACQGPLSPPNDPTPASSAFQGAGNVIDTGGPTKPRCRKGKVRRKGRCVIKKPSRSGNTRKRSKGTHR